MSSPKMSSLKASICVAIYNNANNVKNLFYSIDSTYPNRSEETEFIIYNDGSTVEGVHEELQEFCDVKKIRYLHSPDNQGVAFAWNRLTEAASSEIVILLNDDVRVYSDNWIDHIIHTFDKNERVGIVYWCQRQIASNTGVLSRYTKDSMNLLASSKQLPYLRHNFCGAFFAFRKNVWSQINQPDGSIGFWEDLLSYGEEIDFSSEFLNRDYSIVQLPTIVFEHFLSQTFAGNSDKRLRKKLSNYLPLEEFYQTLLKFPDCFEISARELFLLQLFRRTSVGNSLVRFFRLKESKTHDVSRLDYSKAMLLKKWKSRKILGFDGEDYLSKMYLTGYPSALQSAIQGKKFAPPKDIYFIDKAKAEKKLNFEDCIDYCQDPLL